MHSLALRLPHPSRPHARRAFCLVALFLLCPLAAADARLTAALEQGERLEQLHTLIIAQRGEILAERGYRGHRTTTPSNIKSASRSEEHTSELQSLMRISYAVFCLKKKNQNHKSK